MTNSLFTLPIRRKRDLLRLRQLVRQAAGLVGFDTSDQMALAAAAFDLACQAHAVTGRATADFEMADDCFRVVCLPRLSKRQGRGLVTPPVWRLSKLLPAAVPVDRQDLPWMLRHLVEQTPLDLFEEMKKVNQELLSTLLTLARQREVSQDNTASSAA